MTWLKNTGLLLGILVYRLFRVSWFSSNSPGIKTVVFIQQAKLGDMVCTTPMFKAVKLKYPQAKVIVVGNKVNQYLLTGHSDVDEYVVFSGLLNLVTFLRTRKIDFGCIVGPDFFGLAALLLGNVDLITAPRVINNNSPYETIWYKLLCLFIKTKTHDFYGYAPREYLRLLEVINVFSDDTKKTLFYSKEANYKMAEFFAGIGVTSDDILVGISPSAGNKVKKWSSAKFAKVAEHLVKKDRVKIFVIGSQDDLGDAIEVCSFVEGEKTKIFNVAGHFSLEELKCFISKLQLFISVDTGPIYIAEAFGVPTIDIIGPVDERVQPPVGKKHKLVLPERDKAELFIMDARSFDPKEARRQIESITAEEVVEVADDLLRDLFSI
ncbi:MAG: glycosyltransferase family 9 protein [Candidatus Vogelbacteria bacterium]|nr:glycosyltransferase family 9 protein [Candidatus Vogelbacteria bacterium]